MSLWWILLYMKQSCFQNMDFNDIVNDVTRWLSIWYIYIYINIYYTMISFRCHEDMSLKILMLYNGYIYLYIYDVEMTWENDFYGDDYVVLRAPMGRCYFSLHRGCMGVDSSGRVAGVSTWCRPCWTYPGQYQCGLTIYCFQDFYIIKTKYIYIYDFSKLYIV